MSNEDYDSREGDLFFDFLPEEIYKGLTDEERHHYREYRRYHRFLYGSDKKIAQYQKEIERLKDLIKQEKENQKSRGEYKGEKGWKKQMELHYEFISHLDDSLRISVNVRVKDRSKKQYKIKEGKKSRIEFERQQTQYAGEELKQVLYYMVSVKSNRKNYEKDLYFGSRENVNEKLSPIFDTDVSLMKENPLKGEIGLLTLQYSRCKVYNSSWFDFREGSHGIDSIVEWANQLREQGIDRGRWGTYTDLL